MIYPFELVVPLNTKENALVSVRHFLPPGKITRIAWVMPTGCNDMVKARFLADETQIMPILPDTWMKGNGIMGPFDEDITVAAGGQHFQLVACSPGTTYQHVITLYVDLVEEGAAAGRCYSSGPGVGCHPGRNGRRNCERAKTASIQHILRRKIMEKFWQLLEDSVITQSILTISIWAAIIYLCVAKQEVPPLLADGGWAILGFWFGAKSAQAVSNVRKQLTAQVVPPKMEDD